MLRRAHLCPVLALTLSTAGLSGQGVPALLTDLDTAPPQPGSPFTLGNPEPGVLLGSTLLVRGADPVHGAELWRTDGSAAGTSLVKDLAPGPRSASPASLVVLAGVAYFTADDGGHGRELWRSDGTTAGTSLVKDINPGTAGSDPAALAVVGTTLYFSADDGVHGRELWKSDGTAAGSVLVADILPGAGNGMQQAGRIVPGRHVIVGIPFTLALFVADDGVSGAELWESRGTAASTVLRADINPGAADSLPIGLTAASGHVMFSADDGTTGREPYWIRDGAPTQIADLNTRGASSDPSDFTPILVGGSPRFFFLATNATYGREVFFWDTGVAAGDLLADLNAGTPGSSPEILAMGSVLLIAATNPAIGRELWRTNATLDGVTLLYSFQGGPAGSNVTLAGVISTSPARALIGADDGVHGLESWVTDGSAPGTALLLDASPANVINPPALLGPLPGGRVLFAKHLDGQQRPLVTDGTPAGTFALPVAAGTTLPADPSALVVLGSPELGLFAATHGSAGRELWRTDGTPGGTALLLDIAPGSASSTPSGFAVLGGRCYFTADDGSRGREPWVSDGTVAGTRILRDINPGSAGSAPSNFVAAGGVVFFAASNGSQGLELWRTDGTTAGTVMVVDLKPGGANGVYSLQPLGVVGSRVLFWSDANAAVGMEPWTSDGTAAGTTLLKDLEPGSGNSLVLSRTETTEFNGYTYFTAFTAATGNELWRSSGSAAGTTLVHDAYTGTSSASPHDFVVWGSALYFLATGPGDTTVLWSTSGTSATTAIVRSLARPTGGLLGSDAMDALTATDRGLLFAGWDSAHGFEPWISNGTFGGTALLADLVPGSVSGLPLSEDALGALRTEAWFLALPGASRFLFPATSGSDGIELWRTDGTAAGTARHAELVAGAAGSRPQRPVRLGTRLLFTAVDGLAGNELFAMTTMGLSEPFGVGCPGSNGRIPAISGAGAPAVGNAAYGVQVTGARALATTILLVGFAPLDVPIGGGCHLYLDLTLPPLVLTGATSALGVGVTALPIPADPSLLGLQLWAQMDVVDPGAAFQNLLAVSGGLHVVVGPN